MVQSGVVQQEGSGLQDGRINIDRTSECSSHTFFITGRTHGLLLSSRYAPTPRLTFWGYVSALNPAVSLKMLQNKFSQDQVHKRAANNTPVRWRERNGIPALC